MTINVDPAEMADLAGRIFVAELAASLGDGAGEMIRMLIDVVQKVHRAITTERLQNRLAVVHVIDGEDFWLDAPSSYLEDLSSLTTYYDGQALIVKIEGTGVRVWNATFTHAETREYIVYEYVRPHEEYLSCHKSKHKVPEIATSPSFFGIPYFLRLRVALEEYGRRWVRQSQCEIFADSWYDESRTLFRAGPEYIMRRSLQRFLRSHLRDYNAVQVMPEQNINETRPVDLKITWSVYNRVALIEIKWLGQSASAGGPNTVTYSQARAKQGAAQLADYLDLYHVEQPDEEIRGYLVVYDARRLGVKNPPVPLTREQALHYRNEEIDYDESVINRADFDPPLRFFCEPVLVDM